MDDFQHLDDYALLGVSPNATPDEIKSAYRREITKYHPDRFRGADAQTQQYARERSQRITEAYAGVARNPRSRTIRPVGRRPVTSVEQLAVDYAQAEMLLAAGQGEAAAQLLRRIQNVDPFFRDVDVLLARAEAMGGASGARHKRLPAFAWLGGGVLSLLLLLGGVYAFGGFGAGDGVQQPGGASAVALASASAAPSPSAVTVAEVPVSPSAAVAGGEPGGAAASNPVVVEPTAVSPTQAPPPPTEVPPPPTEVSPPPTEALPTEALPPPTEVPPPPTEAPPPPTEAPLPTRVPSPPTSVPPTPTRRPVVIESGAVSVSEDFSDPASGWPVLQQPNYTLGYRDGVYVITTQPGTGTIFAFGSPLRGSNVVIGADVTAVRGSAGLLFGPNNTYRFLVSGDGRFRVEQPGRVLVPPTASRALRGGTNRLVIAAAGNRASLYANGVLLTNLNLPSPLAGTTYGFAAVPGRNGGEGLFDNLTVRGLPR